MNPNISDAKYCTSIGCAAGWNYMNVPGRTDICQYATCFTGCYYCFEGNNYHQCMDGCNAFGVSYAISNEGYVAGWNYVNIKGIYNQMCKNDINNGRLNN